MPFVFRTVTEEGERLAAGQMLQKPEGELLSVVFNVSVPLVHPAAFAQFLDVTAAVLRPGDFAGENGVA